MTASVKKKPQLAVIACLLWFGLLAGPAIAQDADTTGSTDRVAKRYATPDKAAASSGAASASEKGLDTKIDKIPLPDFVNASKQTVPGTGPQQANPALTQPADNQPYDMDKSAQRSLDAYPQMQSVRAALSSSEESRRQALANFGPVGTVSYAFQRTDAEVITTTSSSLSALPTATGTSQATTVYRHSREGYWQNLYQLQLTVTQPIFTGFKLLSTYQKASLQKDYNEANIKYTELSLIKSVQQVFLTLLQARANVQSNKDSVARLMSASSPAWMCCRPNPIWPLPNRACFRRKTAFWSRRPSSIPC